MTSAPRRREASTPSPNASGPGHPLPTDFVDFGRDICCRSTENTRREWLVTNGLGGYASGTIGGMLTRRYHGLLVAATKPPTERRLLLAKLDETLETGTESIQLAGNVWQGGMVEPDGFIHLERFRLIGSIPTWTIAVGPFRLRKQIFMPHGRNAVAVRYELIRGPHPVTLRVKALANHRGHHQVTGGHAFDAEVSNIDHGVRVALPAVRDLDAIDLFLQCENGVAEPAGEWFENFLLQVEWNRGYDHLDNNLHAADLVLRLEPGGHATVVAGTEAMDAIDGRGLLEAELDRQRGVIEAAAASAAPAPIRHLVLAADQFMVRREDGGEPGTSIIAGYPWFSDWGRDTMLSLPGLCLATGRAEAAGGILETFARHLDGGLLPNRFPDEGTAPEFNSVDASLLYLEAVRRHVAAVADDALLARLWPSLEAIVESYVAGTRHGIGVDPADGLVRAGEDGLQLTWMDAKVGDWVVTPRMGKAVEINALWYSGLRSMAAFASRLGRDGGSYATLADRVESSFDRFWNPETGCCFDVLDGPEGDDPAIRPNQLIAAALEHCPMSAERRERIVALGAERLWISLGIRTLAPEECDYIGVYRGNQRTRDAAYHQGTAWPWLMGPFLEAHHAVHGDDEFVLAALRPFLEHLKDAGLGSISEGVDGSAPHEPGGCIAQAWSGAATLDLWFRGAGRSGDPATKRPASRKRSKVASR
ncbi:MAG: amylo-alpha-1,6-glucosidase [Phycisphaerales bacterium]